jgi:radical SAM-linked protein
MSETHLHRLRVTFATDDTVKYVGHLDMHRAWERAIRRAGLPLAYSQSFNPQPRLHFAAALPVGFTGRAEMVDVFLNEALEPELFLARLAAALPAGIKALRAGPVPREEPSLQSQVCGARYRVEVETDEPTEAFWSRLDAFLVRAEVWRERRRGEKLVRYDLRPLVQVLEYAGPCELGQAFEVAMRSEPGATGRPDELLAELGFEAAPRRIVRLELAFADRRSGDGLEQQASQAGWDVRLS